MLTCKVVHEDQMGWLQSEISFMMNEAAAMYFFVCILVCFLVVAFAFWKCEMIVWTYIKVYWRLSLSEFARDKWFENAIYRTRPVSIKIKKGRKKKTIKRSTSEPKTHSENTIIPFSAWDTTLKLHSNLERAVAMFNNAARKSSTGPQQVVVLTSQRRY